LRKSNPVLVYGKYTLLDAANPQVYAYTREMDGQKLLILLNFSTQNASAKTGLDLSKAKVLLSNYGATKATTSLRPYEAMVIEL
jgi:oligo-1,6-glucosidase